MYAFLGFHEVLEASRLLPRIREQELGAKPYMRIELNKKSFRLYHSFYTAPDGAEPEGDPNENVLPVANNARPIDAEELANLVLNVLYEYYIRKEPEVRGLPEEQENRS